MTYASVPLYRIYCQSTGKGGKPFVDEAANRKVERMTANENRLITVTFSAETTSQMAWNFKPTQHEIRCSPGETVLAFFTAKNPLNTAVNGIATYSVQPYEAGLYLNKIQCFCFEEQRLNPNEEVDLPVFFYIDPEYANDPKLENVNNIVLSYTFFQAKEGLKLPSFMSKPQTKTHYRPPGIWHQCYSGSVPSVNPVLGGNDVNGESLFVGRVVQDGDTIPGKVVPSHGVCYVAYAGQEHAHRDYQVLTNPNGANLVWVPAADGQVPLGALQGGQQSDGQNLFIGRAYHNGSMVIGKVHPGHNTLYVSFGGDEIPIHNYEVLVCRDLCH